ncbi:MAG: Uma2 family endonuclease [Oscillatoriaceae cyanobacterium Prado104]|jgi:Uma2 family endonuclease|nr:Uma2 family endonuclease [Oscillatoriaceae cyanobacterium Prado104]
MVASQNSGYISPEEYLQLEEKSSIKHEYKQGDIYAMAGASNVHVLIAGNLYTLLRNHLRGRGCLPYMADTKVRIESINIYYYPDIAVTCDSRDRELINFLRHPCLIVEVLSPTTEAFDRGDKFADYRHLESLQEYILISQNRIQVDCFRRNDRGQWVLYPYRAGDTIHLASVNFSGAIEDLYEDVDFSPVS